MRISHRLLGAASIGLLLLTTACTDTPPAGTATDAASVAKDVTVDSGNAAIAAAIADPRRFERDVARDASRKPEAILQFAGIKPGVSVLDMFAGGGYYAELAAYTVGPEGRVVAYNNTGYNMVAGKDIAERYADGRLAQVEQLLSENNQLTLPAAAFDVALFILSYHDVYYLDGERGWELIDRPKMLAEVFNAIKPGGVVVVVDHVTEAGMPADVVKDLHRIDPELIKADFQAAGFKYDGEIDVLRNPDDELGVIAMAPNLRGKTDRAVLRFFRP